jgi:hypothetical protein
VLYNYRRVIGRVVTALAATALLAAIASQIIAPWGQVRLDEATAGLIDLRLPEVNGWERRNVPLGQTEEVAEAVKGALKTTGYANCEYVRGQRSFSIYIAYWEAGRLSAHEVGAHNPDNCWPAAGWQCVEWQDNVSLKANRAELPDGAWRVFASPDGKRLHVQFWHFVGGRVETRSHPSRSVVSAWHWAGLAIRQIFSEPREQLFIRIASPEPLETFATEPEFENVLQGLGAIVLHSEHARRGRGPKPLPASADDP